MMQFDYRLARNTIYLSYVSHPKYIKDLARECLDKINQLQKRFFEENSRDKIQKFHAGLINVVQTFAYTSCVNADLALQIEQLLIQKVLKDNGIGTLKEFLVTPELCRSISLIRLFKKIHQGTFKSLSAKEKSYDEFNIDGSPVAIFSKPIPNQQILLNHHIVVIIAPLGEHVSVKIHAKVAFILSSVCSSGICRINVQNYAFTLAINTCLRVTGPFSSIINHKDTCKFTEEAKKIIAMQVRKNKREQLLFSLIAVAKYALHHVPFDHLARELISEEATDEELCTRINESKAYPLKLLGIQKK